MSNQKEMSQWVGSRLVVSKAQVKERLLVLLLADDSGSIESSGNKQAVIDGYNGFIEALRGAPGETLIMAMFLNDLTERGFHTPSEVSFLTQESYRTNGQTPLFLRSVDALRRVLGEAKCLARQGAIVRTMTFIFTDGGDNQSNDIAPADVKSIVDVMLTTGTHVVGACAVSDGCTNFWNVFTAMGIPEQWVKVLDSGRDIRGSMIQMGTMASDASSGGESFTKSSTTGFGSRRPDDPAKKK